MTASAAENQFEDQLRDRADAFLKDLNRDQLLWLSGYLSARIRPAGNADSGARENHKILITYGTETGNSQAIASDLAAAFEQHQIAFELKNLSNLRARHLAAYKFIFLICSTHGDGDPPEPVNLFYTSLMGDDAPKLQEARYAVLALGDSSYPRFCATGQEIDDRLSALGASRILFRQDCDVDYAETSRQWIESLIGLLAPKLQQSSRQVKPPASSGTNSEIASSEIASTEIQRNSPLQTEVIENICLSASTRPDAIHHIELTGDERLMHLQPGDAVGVLVENPVGLVRSLIALAGCQESDTVQIRQRDMPLLQALQSECDITVPGGKLLSMWGRHTDDSRLQQLLAGDEREVKTFLKSHQVIDIAGLFPAAIDAQTLVDGLKPLQPRLYDLANSQQHTSGEMHLIVKRYQYTLNDRTHLGVASDFLTKLEPGASVRLFPYINNRFRLSADIEKPVIYIAEGTGIGPFRAYLQELVAQNKRNRCWLLLAEHSFEEDFLYQSEWQSAFAENRLTDMDAVFSDHESRANAINELLERRRRTLLDYLQADAHLYLCGDRAVLAAVEVFLQQTAKAEWADMQKNKRIHRNLY